MSDASPFAADRLAALRARLVSPDGRAWLGVSVDLFLTVLLALLGWEPVLSFVQSYATVASRVLGGLHLVLVPVVLFLAAGDATIMASDDRHLSVWQKLSNFGAALFLIFGWLLPVCAYTIGRVGSSLFMATIFVHISPVVMLLLVSLLAGIFGQRALDLSDRLFVRTMALFTVPVLTLLFASYLSLVEAFLLMVKTRHGDLGRMALPAWAISYVPARLFFSRLTGLHGPERWTFLAANVHLVVRLALTHPD